MFEKLLNLPNSLTLIRLVFSFLFLPIFLVYLLPFNLFWLNCLLSLIFIFLSLTDFFDGYLARKYGLETNFGKALDPIADKFLVSSTLISLLAVGKLNFFWVIILIGREFFVMGLRQISLENNFSISVSGYGKLKMAFQIIMLSIAIINPEYKLKLINSSWNQLQFISTLITLILSIGSAIQYYLFFIRSFSFVNK